MQTMGIGRLWEGGEREQIRGTWKKSTPNRFDKLRVVMYRHAVRIVFLLTYGKGCNILFGGRENQSKKVVDDGNLTTFITKYRLLIYFKYLITLIKY
jgi:hypothetical protein